MKFTKEQAFEKLKGLLTNDGKKPLRMSEKSINAQLDTLISLVANDETELDDFVTKVKPTFETMNGNAEHDQSSFVETWKREHPATQEPPKPTGQGDGNESEVEKLRKRLETLERESSEAKKQATIATKTKDLLAKLKEKGIKDKDWCEGIVKEIGVSETIDVDAKADSLLALYNKTMASNGGHATPRGTTGGNNSTKGEFDDIRKARESQINPQGGAN